MAEIQPPEGQINGGGAVAVTSSENVGSKRQRRPSVRLGDIGDQTYETQLRRSNKQWKHDPNGKSSKTRPLMNLSSHQTLDGDNLDTVAIGSWNVKDAAKKPLTKRVRSNWVSKIDEGQGGGEGDGKYSGGEDLDDGSRDFERSPVHSLENLAVEEREVVYGRSIRDGVDMSDNDARDWNGSIGRGRYGEDGIRIWLNSLGLGRYAPVFEIHEVDDQVLPLLTLEDLKDMGINAVGSRRKMYCAIQKLGKGFS